MVLNITYYNTAETLYISIFFVVFREVQIMILYIKMQSYDVSFYKSSIWFIVVQFWKSMYWTIIKIKRNLMVHINDFKTGIYLCYPISSKFDINHNFLWQIQQLLTCLKVNFSIWIIISRLYCPITFTEFHIWWLWLIKLAQIST